MIKTDISELDVAIADCKYREDIGGIGVCRDWCIPCTKVIKGGKCDVCRKYFGGKDEN